MSPTAAYSPSFRAPAPKKSTPTWAMERQRKAENAGKLGEERIRQELHQLQLHALHNIILVDDKGPTQIDHVVKTPFGLVVLETKNYAGFIFGHPDNSKWTQRLERGGERIERKFQNPVHQNYRHVKAVEHVLGQRAIPVTSYVIFVGGAKIGDTVASAVLDVHKLGEVLWLPGSPLIDSGNLEAAWECLCSAAVSGEAYRNDHLAMLRSHPGSHADDSGW